MVVEAARGDRDRCALGGEALREGSANPPAAAGDEGDTTLRRRSRGGCHGRASYSVQRGQGKPIEAGSPPRVAAARSAPREVGYSKADRRPSNGRSTAPGPGRPVTPLTSAESVAAMQNVPASVPLAKCFG